MKYMQFLISIPFLSIYCFSEDISLGMKGWDLVQRGEYKSGIELLEKCLRDGDLTLESKARTFRNIGIALRLDNNPTEAIKYFNRSIVILLGDVYCDILNRGNCFSDLNDYESALADYALAEAIYPDDGEINYNRGIVYGRMNDLPSAINEYKISYSKGLRSKLLLERLEMYKVDINQLPNK
jgi:tetratricopeptide (TPR) repeat protein